ncbi:MAG: hypothetical protein KBT11_10015 [Treponema sp.]|nr:hypothetical protein [Candidatus Treponema equifaecale]
MFRIHRFELKLFNKLGVKRWKNKAITARPEFFDVSKVPMEDLLLNMVKAELIHEIIIALSFIPLLFIIPFGVPAVFAATSIFGALVDLKYVIIQRYNRPRVIRIISRTKH